MRDTEMNAKLATDRLQYQAYQLPNATMQGLETVNRTACITL